MAIILPHPSWFSLQAASRFSPCKNIPPKLITMAVKVVLRFNLPPRRNPRVPGILFLVGTRPDLDGNYVKSIPKHYFETLVPPPGFMDNPSSPTPEIMSKILPRVDPDIWQLFVD